MVLGTWFQHSLQFFMLVLEETHGIGIILLFLRSLARDSSSSLNDLLDGNKYCCKGIDIDLRSRSPHLEIINLVTNYCNHLWTLLPPNSQLGSRGRNLQATMCDLGGKLEPSVVFRYSAHPSRPTPSEAKGCGFYKNKI